MGVLLDMATLVIDVLLAIGTPLRWLWRTLASLAGPYGFNVGLLPDHELGVGIWLNHGFGGPHPRLIRPRGRPYGPRHTQGLYLLNQNREW